MTEESTGPAATVRLRGLDALDENLISGWNPTNAP